MQESIITFETALLAKEKGFDIECLHFYTKPQSKMFGIDEHGRGYPIKNKSKSLYVIGEYAASNIESVFYAPTQSLLQKWLRGVHNIECYAYPYKDHQADNNDPFEYRASRRGIQSFETFEEALENELKEGLKLIK